MSVDGETGTVGAEELVRESEEPEPQRIKMYPKKLKKIVKRQTAKKRAQRQTTRRRKQLETGEYDDQVAQDIYESLRASTGETKPNAGGEEYNLKDYNYDMFQYGDPIKIGGPTAIHMSKRQRNSASHAKREEKRDIKKEQKRKALWEENIKLRKEQKKIANRKERKKRKKDEVKRVKKPTSRKFKMS